MNERSLPRVLSFFSFFLFFYSECSLNLWSIRFILSKENFCGQFKLVLVNLMIATRGKPTTPAPIQIFLFLLPKLYKSEFLPPVYEFTTNIFNPSSVMLFYARYKHILIDLVLHCVKDQALRSSKTAYICWDRLLLLDQRPEADSPFKAFERIALSSHVSKSHVWLSPELGSG